jgi:hypothetical protein
MKTGRPRNLSNECIEELQDKFEQYINETPVPIIAEFAYMNNVLRESLYDYPEFSTLMKKCISKKEAQLERGALQNQINCTMAIFSLKQLGWRDKQEHEITGKDGMPLRIEYEAVDTKSEDQ